MGSTFINAGIMADQKNFEALVKALSEQGPGDGGDGEGSSPSHPTPSPARRFPTWAKWALGGLGGLGLAAGAVGVSQYLQPRYADVGGLEVEISRETSVETGTDVEIGP